MLKRKAGKPTRDEVFLMDDNQLIDLIGRRKLRRMDNGVGAAMIVRFLSLNVPRETQGDDVQLWRLIAKEATRLADAAEADNAAS